MRALVLAVVATLLYTVGVTAQVGTAARLADGSLTTSAGDCSAGGACVVWEMRGVVSAAVYVDIGTTATVNWEGSVDATSMTTGTWFAVRTDNELATSATADGIYTFTNVGYRLMRARASDLAGTTTIDVFQGFANPGPSRAVTTTIGVTDLIRVAVFDGADTQITSFTGFAGYAQGAIVSSGNTVIPPGFQRDDTAPTAECAEGRWCFGKVDGIGQIYVHAVPYNSSGTELVQNDITEDVAEAGAEKAPVMLSVRRNVAASSSGATGDFSTINTDTLGLLWSRFLDPCSGVAKTAVAIDIVTVTTTEIINADASNIAYICSINLVTAAANNVSVIEDATDICASPTAGLAGGVTAAEGWNLAANGGLTLGNGQGTVMRGSATNLNICIITSAATQLSGTVVYALAP